MIKRPNNFTFLAQCFLDIRAFMFVQFKNLSLFKVRIIRKAYWVFLKLKIFKKALQRNEKIRLSFVKID